MGYYTLRRDAEPVDAAALHERLRTALPSYMVPAYLERLQRMPMLASDKVDRGSLPPPTGPRVGAHGKAPVAPASHTEQVLADALAEVLGLDRVSVESTFFEDLGANSLLLSRFCARVRSHPGLPALSMREVYQHPTIAALAARLADEPTASDAMPLSMANTEPRGAGRWQYWLCGALQILLFVAYTVVASAVLTQVYQRVSAGNGIIDTYLRALLMAGAASSSCPLCPS